MFSKKSKNTIDSLIGAATRIEGNVTFKGGLRIDGHLRGNITAEATEGSMLIISENARVEGEIHAAHVIVNGEITGLVFSSELLELQPKARIHGDVTYKSLEMHGGAVVSGRLTPETIEEPVVLKLAASNT